MIYPQFTSAWGNFVAAGAVILVLLILFLVKKDLQRRTRREIAEQHESEKADAIAFAGANAKISASLDSVRRQLLERGFKLDDPQTVIHYGKKIDKENGTSVDILRATFYEVGYDVFGVGSDPDRLMVLHQPKMSAPGFDRRLLEFIVLLDEQGWVYDGLEIIDKEQKELQ